MFSASPDPGESDPSHATTDAGPAPYAAPPGSAFRAPPRARAPYHARARARTRAGPRPTTRARPLAVRRKRGDHFTLGPEEEMDLAGLDMILMRQDPPFDMAYITATHLLEHVHPGTLVVNDPAHVRNAPEKLFATLFPDLMPPTIITADRARIDAFRAQHGDIIVKPLYGNGGAGVFHIAPGDDNLNALTELLYAASRQPPRLQALGRASCGARG